MTILSPYEPKLLQCLQKQRAASILAVALLLSSSAFGRNVIIFVADGLRYARKSGFATAAIGKLGPTLIQDIVAGCAKDGSIALPDTVIIDDMTGKEGGVPLDPKIASELKNAGLDLIAPDRSNGQPKTQEDNGGAGNSERPGTLMPNLKQQQFFADALTKAILPGFLKSGKSFVVVFWSRDPDGTQHNLELPLRGRLEGRILIEALNGGPEKVPFEAKSIKSEPAGNGQATRLNYQVVGKTKYFDAAGFPGRSIGLDDR